MSDVQASVNDHAAQSNSQEVATKSDQEMARASHSRKSSEQAALAEQNDAGATNKRSSIDAKHEGDAPANGRASNEDQDGHGAAQTALQSSSAGAPEKSAAAPPSEIPPREKPVDPAPRTVSTSKSKATASRSTSKPPVKSKARRKKDSFLARLFRTLVPCVGPSKALDADGDNASAAPLRDEEKKEKAPEASTTSIGHGHSVEPSATSTNMLTSPLVVPSQHVSAVPPSTDTNAETVVIVPSTPSRRLPPDETAGVTSGAVQPPGSTGTEDRDMDHGTDHSDGDQSSFRTEEDEGQDRTDVAAMHDEDDYDEEERLIMNGGAGIPIGPDGVPRPLLPPLAPQHNGRKCLVLDLDETLVHSSFKLIPQADYVVPVEIEWQWHNVYVIKRPGVDNFLKQMGELYEIVVFTASLSKYADPVLDKLDVHRVVSHRLFRESCYNHKGNYVKDLSQLGRPASDTIILDNSPASYIFHPNNAVPVSSWFNDPHDTELTDLVPFLADLRLTEDVRGVLDGGL